MSSDLFDNIENILTDRNVTNYQFRVYMWWKLLLFKGSGIKKLPRSDRSVRRASTQLVKLGYLPPPALLWFSKAEVPTCPQGLEVNTDKSGREGKFLGERIVDEDAGIGSLPQKPGKKGFHKVDYHKTVQQFNEKFSGILPNIKKITPLRKTRIKQAIGELQDMGLTWQDFLETIEKSSFLCGQNPRKWTANLDWLLRPQNFTKVLEGNYGANRGIRDPMDSFLERQLGKERYEKYKRDNHGNTGE